MGLKIFENSILERSSVWRFASTTGSSSMSPGSIPFGCHIGIDMKAGGLIKPYGPARHPNHLSLPSEFTDRTHRRTIVRWALSYSPCDVDARPVGDLVCQLQ